MVGRLLVSRVYKRVAGKDRRSMSNFYSIFEIWGRIGGREATTVSLCELQRLDFRVTARAVEYCAYRLQ